MPLSFKPKQFLIWLIPLVLVFLLIPYTFYYAPAPTIDYSWQMALHLAVKNHLIFGKDVVFTYGPLGILSYRMPIFVNKYDFLLADLYFFYILFVGFRGMIKRDLRYGPVIFLFAAVLVCQYMETDRWYFFLILFFLFSFLEAPGSNSNLVHAGILSLICLYLKVNSGVLDLMIFMGTIIYAMVFGKVGLLRGAVILLVYLAAVLISAWMLGVYLPGYIIGALQFMKDYENAMYLPLFGQYAALTVWGAVALSLIFLACYILLLVKWIRNRNDGKGSDTL